MTWDEMTELEQEVYRLTDCAYFLSDAIIKADEPESLYGAVCGLNEVIQLLCVSVVKFDEGYVELINRYMK